MNTYKIRYRIITETKERTSVVTINLPSNDSALDLGYEIEQDGNYVEEITNTTTKVELYNHKQARHCGLLKDRIKSEQ